jgi:hypothetical protein
MSQSPQVIYCFNNSTLLKNADMFTMITALNTQLPAFCTAWTNKQYICQAAPANTKPGNAMYCVFLDNTDSAGALAYHTENTNIPLSKVFVGTILYYKGAILMGANTSVPTVAQAFSHEIYEMIVNANVNVWWQQRNGNLIAAEVGDPVQGNVVPVKVGNITVGLTDYVLPAWADPQETKGPFNFLNTLKAPFQVAKGGYMVTMKGGPMTYVMGNSLSEYLQNKLQNEGAF